MRNNITNLIKQELVNQFENVVKNEIRSYEISVASTDNSIKEIHKKLESIQSEQEEIKAKSTFLYLETLKKFNEEKQEMLSSFEEQRRFIRDSSKKLQVALVDFEEMISNLVSKEELSEIKNIFLKDMSDVHKKIASVSEDMSKDIHNSYCENRSYIHKQAEQANCEKEKVYQEIETIKFDLDCFKVDSIGVLREIQVYKKSMFIIEKKIENLYTKLDRIQNRVEE